MRITSNSLKLMAFLSLFLPGLAMAFSATIEAIGGASAVQVKRNGKEVSLKQGDHLEIGDEISTDKSTAVDIRFEDQTILRLGVNSSYKITEDAKSKKLLHRFISGIIRVLVPKKENSKGEIRFKMATPEATIGVRGTEFVVIHTADNTNLKGLTGEVMFGPSEADFNKQEVFVGVVGGFESNMKKGAKLPTKPSKYSAGEYLRELEKREGNPFGPLFARTKSNMKMRDSEIKASVAADKGAVSFKRPLKQEPLLKTKKMADILKSTKSSAMKKGASENPDEMLILSIVRNDEKMAAKAVANKANMNFKDEEGNTLVHYAASFGRTELLKKYLLSDANVNAKNNQGRTPLIVLAAESGDVETAQLLIEAGADIKEKDADGNTAMDWALSEQESEDAAVAARASKLVELLKEASN